jgi:hypothetical protein
VNGADTTGSSSTPTTGERCTDYCGRRATVRPDKMVELIPTGLAVLAAGLIGAALVAMTAGTYRAAGFSFLCASLVIYFRETWFGDGESA